jgi:hypothetical protein
MRRISKRPEGEDVLEDAAAMQRTMNALRGAALVPKGVYRFEHHEEADEWMIRRIANTHARLTDREDTKQRGEG